MIWTQGVLINGTSALVNGVIVVDELTANDGGNGYSISPRAIDPATVRLLWRRPDLQGQYAGRVLVAGDMVLTRPRAGP